MGWLKNVGKTAGDWFSGASKVVAREAKEIGNKAGDIARDVGDDVEDFSKQAMGKISEVVSKVDFKLPALPPMPSIKGPTGKKFIEEKKAWIDRQIKENSDLIEQATRVAGNMVKYKDEIKAARKKDRPLPDSIMEETGATQLLSDAQDKGLESVSIGITGDASYWVGGNASGGINNSIIEGQGLCAKGYFSVAVSGGVSWGADGAIQIGFWEDSYDEISGWTHGVVTAASEGGGVALAFFWKIGGGAGGDFAGWTVSPQAGVSVELEYDIGYTFN